MFGSLLKLFLYVLVPSATNLPALVPTHLWVLCQLWCCSFLALPSTRSSSHFICTSPFQQHAHLLSIWAALWSNTVSMTYMILRNWTTTTIGFCGPIIYLAGCCFHILLMLQSLLLNVLHHHQLHQLQPPWIQFPWLQYHLWQPVLPTIHPVIQVPRPNNSPDPNMRNSFSESLKLKLISLCNKPKKLLSLHATILRSSL